MKKLNKEYRLTITKQVAEGTDGSGRSYPQEEHIVTVNLNQDQVMKMIAVGLDIKNYED